MVNLFLGASYDKSMKKIENTELNPDKLFTKKQAAAYLNISTHTLDRLRAARKISYINFSKGCIRFKESDYLAFIKSTYVKAGTVRSQKVECPVVPQSVLYTRCKVAE